MRCGFLAEMTPDKLREGLTRSDLEKLLLRSRLHGLSDHDMVVSKDTKRIAISKS
jgi:hypothetical protein